MMFLTLTLVSIVWAHNEVYDDKRDIWDESQDVCGLLSLSRLLIEQFWEIGS